MVESDLDDRTGNGVCMCDPHDIIAQVTCHSIISEILGLLLCLFALFWCCHAGSIEIEWARSHMIHLSCCR